MNEQDIVDEYVRNINEFETYEDLVSELRYDDKIEYPEDDDRYLDLATQIISKADCVVCDRCSHIIPRDDAFDIENTNDTAVIKALQKEEDGDDMEILCPDCYNELKRKGE